MRNYLLAMILLAVGVLTGCNTVRGMGQDIKQGGQAIENAAHSAEQKM